MNDRLLKASLDQALNAIAALEAGNETVAHAHAILAHTLAHVALPASTGDGRSARRVIGDGRDVVTLDWLNDIDVWGVRQPSEVNTIDDVLEAAPQPNVPEGLARRRAARGLNTAQR